jgi:hypothetical protein
MESMYVERTNQLKEYMKLHLISLMQDLESLEDRMELLDMNSKDYVELDFEYNIKSGEITATRHLMSVVTDIMGIQIEENNANTDGPATERLQKLDRPW